MDSSTLNGVFVIVGAIVGSTATLLSVRFQVRLQNERMKHERKVECLSRLIAGIRARPTEQFFDALYEARVTFADDDRVIEKWKYFLEDSHNFEDYLPNLVREMMNVVGIDHQNIPDDVFLRGFQRTPSI